MASKGYLTRTDKILFVAVLVVMIPLATLGFPFFGVGLIVLIFGGLAFWGFRGLFELYTKRRPVAPTAPRALNLSRLRSKPMKIKHHYTVNTALPDCGEEDDGERGR